MVVGKFQVQKLESQKAFGADSGTVTIDLPRSNYLQWLKLRIQNTNGATSNTAETIISQISKIEVLADGVTIWNASGIMGIVPDHFDSGHLPASDENQEGSAVQHNVWLIKFGRDANDSDVILPAFMFTTLQLKIDYSFTDSATIGFATSETNSKYDLHARYLVPDEPVGINTPFLMSKEIFSKTLSTIQEETVDLPVGSGAGAYRRIFIRAREAAIDDGVDIDKFELLVNDHIRLVNELWTSSQAEDHARYGANSDKSVIVMKSDTDTYASQVQPKAVGIAGSTCGNRPHITMAGDTVTFGLYDIKNNTAVTADEAVHLNLKCDGVSFATVIDLGTDNIDESLDVGAGSGVSTLKLKLNVAAAGALVKVMTEQIVKF